mgnify:CR=1 FL=1
MIETKPESRLEQIKVLAGKIKHWRLHPEEYCDFMWPDEPLTKEQKQICRSIVTHSETYVYSCNASGKTHLMGKIVNWAMDCWSPCIVVTTAPTFTQVEKQLWGEIRRAFYKKRWKQSIQPLLTEWKLGDNWYAIGLSTNQPDKFQGFHSLKVIVIFDEASGISPVIWEAKNAITTGNDDVFIDIGNPLNQSGPYYEEYRRRTENKGIIEISGYDVVKAGIPGLITQKFIDKQKEDYDLGLNPWYEARVLGRFPSSSIDTVISLADIERAVRNPMIVPGYDDTILGIDPGFMGDDETVISRGKNLRVEEQIIKTKKEPHETAAEVVMIAREHNAMLLANDNCGAGVGVTGNIRKLGWSERVLPLDSSSTEGIDEEFYNLRAAMWWNARDMFRQGIIGIPDEPELRRQLAGIHYFRHPRNGKIIIESKDDIKKNFGVSPNRADSVVYWCWGVKIWHERKIAGDVPEQKVVIPWQLQEVTRHETTEGDALGLTNH